MGIQKFENIFRKGRRGSVAVPAAALGYDRAGGGAGRGIGFPNAPNRVWGPIPEPEGKQRGRRRISVSQVSESMKRSEFHV
jgi:hypothetical protein